MYLVMRRASGTATSTDDAEYGDEHKPGDDPQMLEEDIELPDALDPVERPELLAAVCAPPCAGRWGHRCPCAAGQQRAIGHL